MGDFILISPNSPNHDLISQLQSAQTVHFASFLSLTHAIYFAELVGSLSLTLIHLLMLSALLRLEADHPHHIIDLYLFALEWELFAVWAGYRFEHFFL